MPADAKPDAHAPRKLRVETLAGLVFGTLSAATPPLEEYLGAEFVRAIRRVMRAPVKVLGSYSQSVAEQLEALHGERQGLLSCEPVAHLLHHLPAQPPVAEGRVRGQRKRRQSHQLFDGRGYRRQGIRAGRHARGAGRASASKRRKCWRPSTNSATASACKFCRCSRASCCSRPATVSRCAGWCRMGLEKTELVWTCFGFDHRRRGDDRAPPAPGQSDRAGRLHLDGGRRRAGLRAARRQFGVRRTLGGGDGRSRHRVRRHPRHRGRGARLLDRLSRAYGTD